MVKTLVIFFVFILLSFFCELFSQNQQIETRKKELEKLRTEILLLENELSNKSTKEKKSLAAYDALNKQSFLVNKLLTNLRREEEQKQKEIEKQISSIAEIEKEIDQLQKNYAKYVTSTYKNGTYSDWESLIDADNFRQAVIRMEYLKRFSISREKDLFKLNENKKSLITAKEKLEVEKKEKQVLTKEKESEEKTLSVKIKNQKSLLAEIKKDKNKISKSVKEKKNSEQKIRNMILKLVEESEQKRKSEDVKKNETFVASTETRLKKETELKDYTFDLSTANFASFSELKGKMNWPISKGRIVKSFGEAKNKNLNTITVNYGIDIKAGGDMSVRCVADGVISTLEWLPGYGTVLIISHKGNYRTVYGHLSEVFVREGDKVKTGGVIAKVGESIEGNILHFEIWNGRQNVNPESWLRK